MLIKFIEIIGNDTGGLQSPASKAPPDAFEIISHSCLQPKLHLGDPRIPLQIPPHTTVTVHMAAILSPPPPMRPTLRLQLRVPLSKLDLHAWPRTLANNPLPATYRQLVSRHCSNKLAPRAAAILQPSIAQRRNG